MKEEKKFKRLSRVFERYFKTLVPGRALKLVQIDPEIEDQLGYTSYERGICNMHLAMEHPIINKLSEKEKTLFVTGVFAHETLHQIFTDFAYTNRKLSRYPRNEAQIVMTFANLLEDAAIEFWSPTVLGSDLLEALNFSIKKIYLASPNIGESESAFAQLINALVQFGDLGIIKGHFTFPEASKIFSQIAPKFNAGIEEPLSYKRIDIAAEFMEISRPLWEKEQKAAEEFQKALKNCLKKLQIESLSGSDFPIKNGDGSSCEDEGDGKDSDNESNGAENVKKASASRKKIAENREKSLEDSANGAIGTKADEAAADAENAISVNMSAADNLEEEMEEAEAREERKMLHETLDLSVESPALKGVNCDNRKPATSNVCMYKKIVNSNKNIINALTGSLKRILKKDSDEMLHFTSGKYNIKRAQCKVTAKLFDKKKEVGDKRDLSIFLLIDESGSMYGRKIETARKLAIIFAETFENLGIPYYVMGFTADMGKYDVVHEHFTTFNSPKSDRYSLSQIDSHANNLDGYSIRYAGKLLNRVETNRKLLFVISDGRPAACKYRSENGGIKDTTNAIKEVRKSAEVFGFGLGGCPTEILHAMYGKDYIHVENVDSFVGTFSRKLKKMIGGTEK